MEYNLIDTLFLPHDAELIKTITLSAENTEDRPIWHHAKHVNYTVCSGYFTYIEEQRRGATVGGPADGAPIRYFWTKIWTIPMIPKVKTLLWKILNQSLPVRSNLARRIAAISPLCPICAAAIENEKHCLLGCHWQMEIWSNALRIPSEIKLGSMTDILQWFIKHNEESKLAYVALLLWYIWKAGCSSTFNEMHTAPSPLAVVAAAARSMLISL